MNRFVFFTSFLILIPTLLFSRIEVIEQTDNSVTLEYRLESYQHSVIRIDGVEYHRFDIGEGNPAGEFGQPAVPVVTGRLAIPSGARVTYQISIIQSETVNDATMLPLGAINGRGDGEPVYRESVSYESAGPYPEEQLRLGEPYDFRGIPVVPLELYPILYYPMSRQIVLHKTIRITFRFAGGQIASVPKIISWSEKTVIKNKILNPVQAEKFMIQPRRSFQKTAVNYDLSTGRWFRIPITEEGIYEISGSFLQSAGVDIRSIQTAGIHMYNYGGNALSYDVNASRPADLNEIAIKVIDGNQDGIMDASDRILFYGKGMGGWKLTGDISNPVWQYSGNPDGTGTLFPYDNANYYLLTFNSQPGRRIETVPTSQNSNPVRPTAFTDYFHFETDEHNILASGLDWYWLKMTGLSDSKSTSFFLPQNILSDTMSMKLQFHGGSGSFYGTTEYFLYKLKAMVNNQTLVDNIVFSNTGTVNRTVQAVPINALRSGENNLVIEHIGNLDGCEVYLDYFEVSLKRPLTAENGELRWRYIEKANSEYEYQIAGMPAGQNTVWDVSDFDSVREITPSQNGSSVVFRNFASAVNGAYYYVYSPASVRGISALEPVENHPNLRDPSRRAEFIIITPPEFLDGAEFLENWRESQIPDRLETERISLDQIFTEFSSSVRDVTAIRDFLKYAYENWSDTLQYVLLFGDGHYDYRNIRLEGVPNFVPPFEITPPVYNNEVNSRETDNFYVAFGMTGNLGSIDPTIPVGRLPVADPAQMETYRDKADKYRKSFLVDPERNGWQTWLTFVADDDVGGGNQGGEFRWHLEPTEQLINAYIPERFNLDKIYLHEYDQIPGGLGRWKPKATENLVDRINRGTLMINYFGHGDTDTWAHESVLNRSRDLPKIQNIYRLPFWVAATCTWGKFDNPSRPSMSEELLWLSQKGGIGVISAGRPVYAGQNIQFTKSFYSQLFDDGPNVTTVKKVGDAFFLSTQPGDNYQKFHLYSDPTQKLAAPKYNIQVRTLEPDTLRALSTVTVTADIMDEAGNPVTDFNGTAILQVFDAEDKKFVPEISLNYVSNGGTIFKGLVTVTGGELTGQFIVPKSIKYDPSPSGRLSIYAWSDDQDATGYNDSLLLYGTEPQVDDQDGPDIVVSFEDNPNFFDGDFVSNQPTLLVDIDDRSGINLTGEVGHRIELTIDESVKKDVTDFFVYEKDSYTQGKVEYTLPVLTAGNHTLKIACWDNLNNYSEKVVTFRTSGASDLMMVDVVNFPNPFSDRTWFTFQLDAPEGFADVTISVYTVTGRKIYEWHDVARRGFNKLPNNGWDGRDWDGDLVANGVYLYKITVDDGSRTLDKIEKMAIVR